MGHSVNMRLDPCGHLLCSTCFNILITRPISQQICPKCRTPIVKSDRIFYGGDYKNKYLKYKAKYISIKKRQGKI